MSEINNLLNYVKLSIDNSAKISDASGSKFNMFKILGVNHYENTHSKILAEFLNPQGTHSSNSLFLELFISLLINNNEESAFEFNANEANVTTEQSASEGRMDIVIESKGKAIIIENKIHAGDQWEQLKRYDTYAKETYGDGNYKLIYLTLYGSEPSEQSAKDVDECVLLSHRDDIIRWLKECAKISYDKPKVRETFAMYIDHLMRLTGIDLDKKTEEALVYYISNIDNLRTANNIAIQLNNYNSNKDFIGDINSDNKEIAENVRGLLHKAKENIFRTEFQANLRKRLAKIDCALVEFDDSNHLTTSYYGFRIKPNSWKSYSIVFQFNSKYAQNLYYGIPKLYADQNDSNADAIANTFSKNPNKWWCCYAYMSDHKYWGIDEYIMMSDKTSSLYNTIISNVKLILEKSEELSFL